MQFCAIFFRYFCLLLQQQVNTDVWLTEMGVGEVMTLITEFLSAKYATKGIFGHNLNHSGCFIPTEKTKTSYSQYCLLAKQNTT